MELAIALFAGQRLSLGKAAELAGLPVGQSQRHLATRHLGRRWMELRLWLCCAANPSWVQMLTTEAQAAVERVVKALKAGGAREVYLCGSAATGRMGEDSELYFAVSGLPPRDFYPAVTRAMRAAGSPVDVVDLDLPTPFTRHLRQEKKLFRVG